MGLFAASHVVFAQTGFQIVNCGTQANPTPCEIENLKYIVVRIINYLSAWAWLVTLLFVFWAAYNMITSGGNAEKVTSAKGTLNHAILGFFLVSVAYILLNWVTSVLTGLPLQDMIKFIP